MCNIRTPTKNINSDFLMYRMEYNGLLKLEDILKGHEALITSQKKDVRIYGIVLIGERVELSGYVNSGSREGYAHPVKAVYEELSRRLLYSDCTCESRRYNGDPCKHSTKLWDVYIRNARKTKF